MATMFDAEGNPTDDNKVAAQESIEAMAAELGRSISAFLRTQSEEVRSMFILRYFYCEPVEALAARFHCGESRIKTTLLRTRRKLKEHLIK